MAPGAETDHSDPRGVEKWGAVADRHIGTTHPDDPATQLREDPSGRDDRLRMPMRAQWVAEHGGVQPVRGEPLPDGGPLVIGVVAVAATGEHEDERAAGRIHSIRGIRGIGRVRRRELRCVELEVDDREVEGGTVDVRGGIGPGGGLSGHGTILP
jgi:hypothetical protein